MEDNKEIIEEKPVVEEVKTGEEKKEAKPEDAKAKETGEEKKAEKPKEDDSESLKTELAEATKKVAELEATKTELASIREEVKTKDSTIKEYEELIQKMVETKMEQLPEDYKELIPENLELKQKLAWLEKAEAKGLFNKEEKKKPNVEIGKPLNVDVPQVDTAKLSGSQLLRMAYNTIKK